ncbi:MAG: glycosyltransferase family 4 protein [Candidatus Sulfobium sp.]
MDLKIVVIVNDFPTRTETFVRRHIAGLHSDVVAVNMDESDLYGWDFTPLVSCLFRNKRKNENMRDRLVRRLKEMLLGSPSPRWPKGMEEVFDGYVKERKPDVALAEFAPTGISAMKACQKHGIPLVIHFHGYDASSLLRFKSYRACLPSLFEKSAAVVVVSQAMRDRLQKLGCPPEKISIIPCGAPVEELSISGNVEKQPCKFLTAASFTPMKGSLYTLRALARCVEQCPDVTLTMIGDGKEYRKALNWVRRHDLSQKIHMLGFQSNKVVHEHMAKAGVFLQHSITTNIGHVEGCPVSLAEAAASGLPIVATTHGGIPDEVIDGETGFLVEERNWEAMAEKMIFLANNPEKRKEMGLAGRNNIELVGNTRLQINKLREVLTSVTET